jgi:hypothetical protein
LYIKIRRNEFSGETFLRTFVELSNIEN